MPVEIATQLRGRAKHDTFAVNTTVTKGPSGSQRVLADLIGLPGALVAIQSGTSGDLVIITVTRGARLPR